MKGDRILGGDLGVLIRHSWRISRGKEMHKRLWRVFFMSSSQLDNLSSLRSMVKVQPLLDMIKMHVKTRLPKCVQCTFPHGNLRKEVRSDPYPNSCSMDLIGDVSDRMIQGYV